MASDPYNTNDDHSSEEIEALRAEIEKLRAELADCHSTHTRTFENAGVGIAHVTLGGNIIRCNPYYADFLGYSCKQLVGKRFVDLTLSEDIEGSVSVLRGLVDGSIKVARFEKRYIHRNGSIVWGDVTSTVEFRDPMTDSFLITTVQDITERKHAEERLEKAWNEIKSSELFFRELTELLPQIIWAADPHGRVTHVNRRWYELTGAKSQLIENWNDFIHPDDVVHLVSRWQHCLAESLPFEYLYRLKLLNTGYRWYLIRANPVRDRRGQVSGWVGSCTDVNAQKEAELARKNSDEAKDHFLAVLSHELKSPLAAIIGYSELLDELEPGTDDFKQALKMIRYSAETESRIVADILEYSRYSTGKLELNKEPVRLADVIDQSVGAVRIRAVEKKLAIKVDTAGMEREVLGDRVRLLQIFENLLSNAVKFTPEGGEITITLTLQGEHAVIKVSDTGCGIDRQFLPRIFDRFTQQDSSRVRKYGGLGLGLSLVKLLTELHGGQVQVHSPGPGKGSTFTVRLPILDEQAVQAELLREAQDDRSIRGRIEGTEVLVIDNDRAISEMTAAILRLAGAQVDVADRVNEALHYIRKRPVDLIISELSMPDIDGFSLAQLVKDFCKENHYPAIPLIALTALGSSEDRFHSQKAGFAQHLTKPVKAETLIRAVERHRNPLRPQKLDACLIAVGEKEPLSDKFVGALRDAGATVHRFEGFDEAVWFLTSTGNIDGLVFRPSDFSLRFPEDINKLRNLDQNLKIFTWPTSDNEEFEIETVDEAFADGVSTNELVSIIYARIKRKVDSDTVETPETLV